MKPLSQENRRLMASLQKAVGEALERKRRLGQYAVIWRDGAPAFIGPNPPVAAGACPPSREGGWHRGVAETGESQQG